MGTMDVELVKQDAAEVADARAVANAIKAALADGREALWRLAEALHAFDEMRGWRDLGYRTLSEWLADADVAITRGTYYRLVKSWRKLVVERKVDADRVRLLDQSKVAIVVDRIAGNEVKVDDAFADVAALGTQDLRAKYAKKPNRGADPDIRPKSTTELSGRMPEVLPVSEDAAASSPGRQGLATQIERLLAVVSSVATEASDGAPAGEIEATVMTLEAVVAEVRTAVGAAVAEEGRAERREAPPKRRAAKRAVAA